jgi:SAM-dependent methyltransferase
MSFLGGVYERVYGGICGRHPRLMPWHFQWLPSKVANTDLKRVLAECTGRILDVGCGAKPYERWLPEAEVTEYTGVDRHPGPRVDIVVGRTGPWPIESESYDTVICTQVLEHVQDLPDTLGEIDRILKPGGKIVITLPFLYNAHGVPEDYRRLSVDGVRSHFSERFEIIESKGQGGVGSTLGLLFLNWVDSTANLSIIGRMAKGILLPLWLVLACVVNAIGWLLDRIDRTSCFYSNVILVGIKR